MDNNLIFDLGYHNGKSTINFLNEGYKIIAVECSPVMVDYIRTHYESELNTNQIILVDKAITDKDNDIVDFYICNYISVWSSCNPEIPYRRNDNVTKIQVPTITLKSLIQEYGCPYYCKIDIEGNDAIAIKSIIGLSEIPKFISAESECTNYENRNSIDPYEVLDAMKDAGYTQFSIIEWDNKGNNVAMSLEGIVFKDYNIIKSRIATLREQYDFENKLHFWIDIIATY